MFCCCLLIVNIEVSDPLVEVYHGTTGTYIGIYGTYGLELVAD